MVESMVRKQVYITRDQEQRLKRVARERGVPEAEVLREGLTRLLESEHQSKRTRAAWTTIEAFIQMQKERAREEETGTPHKWKREEFYEDRLSRYG